VFSGIASQLSQQAKPETSSRTGQIILGAFITSFDWLHVKSFNAQAAELTMEGRLFSLPQVLGRLSKFKNELWSD